MTRLGVPIVITYPGSVTGPAAGTVLGEATQGISGNIKLGSLPSHDAAWSLIDARDLGAIHAALMVKGLGPRRFMCGGHYVRMEDLATQLQRLTGRAFKVLPLPGALLRGLGRAADAIARVVPFDSVFTEEAMICFTQQPPTDDRATLRALGIRYRPVAQTLRGILRVWRIPDLGKVLAMHFFAYAAMITVLGLWAGPYLADVHGLDPVARGNVLLAMGLAQAAGVLCCGPLDRVFNTRKWVIVGAASATLAVLLALALIARRFTCCR